ncbi:MAG: cation:proton antiporter [Lachnospirales bacterium]
MREMLSEMAQGPYFYLLAIAVILLSTKVLGLASRKVSMPAVVGALIAGVILGPSLLNLIDIGDPIILGVSEIGVILLMFESGLETNLDELKANGVASCVVAIIGVVVPLVGGMATYYLMNPEGAPTVDTFKAIFVGVTLTATSVSITVETLREMGKLSGRMGTTILGAAVMDDIIGVVVLTAIISLSGGSGSSDVSLSTVIIRILLFFVFIAIVAIVVIVAKNFAKTVKRRRRISIYAFAFCLILSFASEEFFGVADITGAYFAGVILCNFGVKDYIGSKFEVLSFLFFSPVFFASIGLKTNLHLLTPEMMVFALVLLAVAILSKILGCGLGAKICKFDNKEALSIGIGMVSRGEVALIVAQKGADSGLLNEELFPAIVFMVIITTLITPILLKVVLKDKKPKTV